MQSMPIIETITDVASASERLRLARYGVIQAAAGECQWVQIRAWPQLLSWREIWPVGHRYHARGPSDRCRIYYNQPRRASSFIALKYLVSTRDTSYATVKAALQMLDHIAALKQVDAMLCDAANSRLSDRMMQRHGWASHAPMPWRRNFIKRFYGQFPTNGLGV